MVGSPRSAYAQMLGVTVEVDTVFGGPSDIDPTGQLEELHQLFDIRQLHQPHSVLGAVFSDTALA